MTSTKLIEWTREALTLHQSGRVADAESLYTQALRADRDFYPALHLMGLLRLQQGRAGEALPFLERALAVRPAAAETLSNYAVALGTLGRFAEALAMLQKVVEVAPNDSNTRSNRGALLSKLQRYEEALVEFDRAIALNPTFADALMNRGEALLALARPEEALVCYDRVLTLAADHVEARCSRGVALKALGRAAEALAEFDRVLSARPGHVRALICRGTVLRMLGAADQELQSYDRALAIQPDMPEALLNRAYCRWTCKSDLAGAIHDLERAVAIKPDFPGARGDLLLMRMHAADWRDFARARAALDEDVRAGRRVIQPYVYQALSSSPADLLASARIYARHNYPPQAPAQRRARGPGRIRLGYVSGEFRAQATMHLAAGLFEHHDRSRFEVIAFDNSLDDGSPMRRRVLAAFDEVVPIQALSDGAAARRIADRGIDILINLSGYMGSPRMGAFARRPAALQVNYLGFPGTLGADYIDYILADADVIPRGEEPFYAEKVVRLPGCYQINDAARPRPTATIRAAHALREADFVFCHFNHSYKITPEMFALWLRLLQQVPASVLWLLENNALIAANLRREASQAGVDPTRLVFAPLMDIGAHLARLALADLFLDSLPYNAHTTASDALWVGLPLVTCRGQAFAGRVAASLLRAVELPTLITRDLSEYEALALDLARNPARLRSMREHLTRDPVRLALFDTARTTRQIEAAYEAIMRRWTQGQLPESFALPK